MTEAQQQEVLPIPRTSSDLPIQDPIRTVLLHLHRGQVEVPLDTDLLPVEVDLTRDTDLLQEVVDPIPVTDLPQEAADRIQVIDPLQEVQEEVLQVQAGPPLLADPQDREAGAAPGQAEADPDGSL